MKTKLLLLLLLLTYSVYPQISTKEKPIGLILNVNPIKNTNKAIKFINQPNINFLKQEDEKDDKKGIPPRFGYRNKVNFNMSNSGEWITLGNGDKLWRLNINSPGALSLNLLYDKFWLPAEGKLFIYSKDGKNSIGAFTSINNNGKKDNIKGFATGLIYADDIIIEYWQPAKVKEKAIISIEYVVYGYRYININNKDFGSSLDCEVNINCSVGQNWQKEKDAVALILVNGNRYCTGSLINTTAQDLRPLLLTADHCLGGPANNGIKYDAESNPDLPHYSFYWHYEHPNCNNTNSEPLQYSTSGATVKANNPISDFALLELTEDPRDLNSFTPYYLGWDKTGNAGSGGVSIHHPKGDVKKISIDNDPLTNYASEINWTEGPVSLPNTHWKSEIDIGTQEGGSSGSPILNYNHKVIGQLHGGQGGCAPVNKYYGKFNVSWTGNNNPNNFRKLQPWLDPINSGVSVLNGKEPYKINGTSNICPQNQAAFYIEGGSELPNNTRYEWSHSSNLSYVSGQNTVQYKVKAPNYSDNAWVQVKILYPINNYTPARYSSGGNYTVGIKYDTIILPKKHFTIGLGASTGNEISDCPPLEGFFYENAFYAFSFNPPSGNTSIITGYQWNVSGGTIIHGNENSEMIQVKVDKLSSGSNWLQVSVNVTTSCGNIGYYNCYAPIQSELKSNKLIITPNPTSDNITITLSNKEEAKLALPYDIIIVDIANNIKYYLTGNRGYIL